MARRRRSLGRITAFVIPATAPFFETAGCAPFHIGPIVGTSHATEEAHS